jgi:hypothetical protein
MRFSHCLHTASRGRVRLALLSVVTCACAVIALAGCASSTARQSAPTPAYTPTIAATPTPPATPRVVFQADWSHGAGAWKLPPHWSIQDGALVTDGLTQENLPVPYTVTAENYRIVMMARVVDVTFKTTSCNNFFGILAQNTTGSRLFAAEAACFGPLPYHGQSQLLGADGTDRVWELIVGGNVRTYRVDVYGNQAVYFPGGAGSIGGITNAELNSPAQVFIEASQVKLVITSFVIMTI